MKSMKNLIKGLFVLIYTLNLIHAEKMIKSCPSAYLHSFQQYKNTFLKENRYKKYKDTFLAENKDFFYYLLKNDFNGNSFKCVSQKLLDNKKMMLNAVVTNRRLFEYISKRLKKDRDVVLNAIQKFSYNLKYVDKSLLSDKEIVLLGLKSNGMFLKHVDEKLKNDRDIVKQAFKARANSLEFASDTLKNNREFMLELAKINHYAYDYIGESLKKDKELALIGLVWWEERLEHMDMIFRDDPEMVLKAIEQHIKYFAFASKRIRNDKKIIFSLITYNANVIKYVHDDFKNNKELMLEAISKHADTYRWIGESLKEDRDICIATIRKNGFFLKLIPKKYQKEKAIVEIALRKNGLALKYASKKYRDDKELVKMAIKAKGSALLYASLRLQKDKELIDLARKHSKYYDNKIKSSITRTIHPDAWKSYIYKDTLEILYGKDAHFTQSAELKISKGIQIETSLKLKSIAILQHSTNKNNLIAWYIVESEHPIKFFVDIKYAKKYTVIAEGVDGKLYSSTHEEEAKYYGCSQAYLEEERKYKKFFNSHLKRKITNDGTNTHLDFMIVNKTNHKNFITKVRIEMGGKTVFTIHTSPYLSKNPYFNILLTDTKKEEVTIFCKNSKHRKEYVWEDKTKPIKEKEKKGYEMILWQ